MVYSFFPNFLGFDSQPGQRAWWTKRMAVMDWFWIRGLVFYALINVIFQKK